MAAGMAYGIAKQNCNTDGWSFEMRIPYSALRFSSAANQTWGLNITRRRNKTGQQYMWSPVDQKNTNFMSQEGSWTGIENIEPPLRLSLSPYFSAYANHYPSKQKEIKSLYPTPSMAAWM